MIELRGGLFVTQRCENRRKYPRHLFSEVIKALDKGFNCRVIIVLQRVKNECPFISDFEFSLDNTLGSTYFQIMRNR